MKKLFALLALVTMAFTACNKGEETPATKSSIVPETTVVEFSRLGGTQVVRFSIKQAQGGKVTATENCDWLEAVTEYNSDLVITAQANEMLRQVMVGKRLVFSRSMVSFLALLFAICTPGKTSVHKYCVLSVMMLKISR